MIQPKLDLDAKLLYILNLALSIVRVKQFIFIQLNKTIVSVKMRFSHAASSKFHLKLRYAFVYNFCSYG